MYVEGYIYISEIKLYNNRQEIHREPIDEIEEGIYEISQGKRND